MLKNPGLLLFRPRPFFLAAFDEHRFTVVLSNLLILPAVYATEKPHTEQRVSDDPDRGYHHAAFDCWRY